MWRPGFAFEEAAPALLKGAHRALCVYSWVHRGTRDRPGLVLGLDRGGSCRGVAYRVDGARREQVIAYLREREQVTGVYQEAWRSIRLDRPQPVRALTYVVDRRHVQYAGTLTPAVVLAHIRAGPGQSGDNREYVLNTAGHLRDLGVRDNTLDWLAGELLSERRATEVADR
jgi:cation transport protein ChaC